MYVQAAVAWGGRDSVSCSHAGCVSGINPGPAVSPDSAIDPDSAPAWPSRRRRRRRGSPRRYARGSQDAPARGAAASSGSASRAAGRRRLAVYRSTGFATGVTPRTTPWPVRLRWPGQEHAGIGRLGGVVMARREPRATCGSAIRAWMGRWRLGCTPRIERERGGMGRATGGAIRGARRTAQQWDPVVLCGGYPTTETLLMFTLDLCLVVPYDTFVTGFCCISLWTRLVLAHLGTGVSICFKPQTLAWTRTLASVIVPHTSQDVFDLVQPRSLGLQLVIMHHHAHAQDPH